MNEIITNGTGIKQRIISEINNSKQCVYLAMAWFTDRDIANALIDAKNRNVFIDIILSSNAQNETVKQMLKDANINVHAFDTGDERGMMHHKFCLLDNKISINGSYNYSYNASNNNVENVNVSDDYTTYKQLFVEFERLKYNIDHNIDVNTTIVQKENNMQQSQPQNFVDAFFQQLNSLVYLSAQIDAEDYKKQGYEKSKESEGNIDIFKSEYNNIKEKIRVFATDEGLSSKKNILTSNISSAFEGNRTDLENDKLTEINVEKREIDLEKRQISDKNEELKQRKSILETGNNSTSEKGLFQINKEIEKNKLEQEELEGAVIVKRFWTVGTVLALLGLAVFIYYLSIFFASAMYKVFFEANTIRTSLEAGINPGLPQLVDANAILKIFSTEGSLFGIMAILFFLIPISLSNLKLFGSEKKWVNILCFWIGVLIFDVLVATMVAINTDEIKSLLVGQESQMKIWDVVTHGEFWLIFVFGMLPLIITHFIINYVSNSYKKSQREIVDAEKTRKIQLLARKMIDLNGDKEVLLKKIDDCNNSLKDNNDKISKLEQEMNNRQNQIENKYADLLKQTKIIFDDFNARITSGKIFTDEILSTVISAYKAGFIEYLPNYYSENEVTKRVNEIEQVVRN
ncbi:phospholipase D-like domain-containing protein [Parabacteroides sp. PF5-9]|uniref:phospholipase D-like domain-containing protein n=1 Tax=Parabacteroides sp. PF5-9 TaxID=1742404 RepID=UPI0024763B17|nr:phospholipase D-like domain-containing protein [Parabacteroides sp. PF5-9]MDH6357590.1 putative nuclease with TOPRIM domain [Parabacteroides sp. PF5-9]